MTTPAVAAPVRRKSRRILIWIAIVVVAAAGWYGVTMYLRVRGTVQAVKSATNLREMGQALFMYAQEHRGRYPDRLSDLLLETDIEPSCFVTPWGGLTPPEGATPGERAKSAEWDHCSYAYVGAGRLQSEVGDDDPLVFEADDGNPSGGVYILFGDGHGEMMTKPRAVQLFADAILQASRSSTTRPTTRSTQRK